MRARTVVLSLAALAMAAGAWEVEAATTIRVASGLDRPVLTKAPNGDPRLFIVEQRGVIKVWKDGVVLPEPFLDIDPLVPNISGYDERGLLGLAFPPDYEQSGRFYVHYTNLSNNTTVARYAVSGNPDVADPASAEVLLTVDQPYTNHNGGSIEFSPVDGYLYIGLGDGGSSGDPGNRAQSLDTLLGKILRLDVSGPNGYSIPADNPFAGDPGARDEIWALGLRNPFRFAFDRLTGDLWIGDVGQSDWEEIDFQPASSTGGENYGWRLMEGAHCYNPPSNCDDGDPVLTYPVHEYPHGPECSITGGYVYRGQMLPELQGAYFFADYCSGRIWSLRYDGQSVSDLVDRTEELAPGGGLSIGSIASFGEDGFGELVIVDRGGTTTGEIYRVVPDDPSSVGGPDDPVATRILSASPNPFRNSVRIHLQAPATSALQVSVVDASGRKVREIHSGPFGGGQGTLSWDGRDAEGREVPSGVYFLRSASGNVLPAPRLILLR